MLQLQLQAPVPEKRHRTGCPQTFVCLLTAEQWTHCCCCCQRHCQGTLGAAAGRASHCQTGTLQRCCQQCSAMPGSAQRQPAEHCFQ